MKNGYAKAMSLLEERYGKPYIIATAHVKKLVDGPVIKPEDGESLQKFSINLLSCVNTLEELNCIQKLDAPDNLRKIISKLPYRIQSSWRDKVDQIIQKENRDVTIKDIADFVTAKARATTHPVFGVIGSKDKNVKQNIKGINYAVEVETFQRKCSLCSGTHWLSRCGKFKQTSVPARLEFVRQKRLCMNCLSTGHYVAVCPKPSFCKICTEKHSTFLHPTNKTQTETSKRQPQSVGKPTYINTDSGNSSTISMASKCKGPGVSLAAVPVRVRAKGGN
ncbi:uncharacterized protein LOC117121587, partial [Anneissia japonica]|uniref:uncharacterized protein LOC117121587 n=1 Tax=Anneissia japonica TaxID=1529436 RepID=UPI00142578DA